MKLKCGGCGACKLCRGLRRLREKLREARALEREAATILPDAQTPSDRRLVGGLLGSLVGSPDASSVLLTEYAYGLAFAPRGNRNEDDR